MFWTTELANQSTQSKTTTKPMRGKRKLALDLMLRNSMPVPSSNGASIGNETCTHPEQTEECYWLNSWTASCDCTCDTGWRYTSTSDCPRDTSQVQKSLSSWNCYSNQSGDAHHSASYTIMLLSHDASDPAGIHTCPTEGCWSDLAGQQAHLGGHQSQQGRQLHAPLSHGHCGAHALQGGALPPPLHLAPEVLQDQHQESQT